MPQMPNITVQLVHIQGPLKGQIQDFSQFPVQIGRHSSCQVRFEKDLTAISRRHACIERQGNRFRIIDASTNGTYVNGKRIADVYLRDGDVITFSENGPKASFLTKIETGNAPVPPAPLVRPSPPSPSAPMQPQMSAPAPVPPVTAPSAPPPRPQIPEPGLTVGPDLEIPVISANAPLVIQFGPTLQSYNLLPVTIGTDPACEFVIANNALTGRHVQIFFSENDYYVKDLTGRNVVSINGRPVGAQSVLAQGAELSLTDQGPKFRFLGGGRLAEIQDVVSEPLDKTDADPNLIGSDRKPSVPQKKSKSLFKSFFS
ncbi:MAG: FHA domain-containing protein [Desulfosarcina sp.]|nr:FHA domain-containing protein [Desulfosarcina sp.]MBC2741665.1 FHA domain-containing protein [Desulfosarcina sp.]MBC2764579.1 FHA domain-containing protein [Desulfosarcina sp.]